MEPVAICPLWGLYGQAPTYGELAIFNEAHLPITFYTIAGFFNCTHSFTSRVAHFLEIK